MNGATVRQRVARSFVTIVLATSLSSGCYHIRYGTHDPTGVEHSEWSHFFFFGIIGKKRVNASDLCPSGVARIHSYTSFVNGLVTVFPGIFGLIWAPRTLEITCKAGGGAVLELDGEGRAHTMRVTSPEGASEPIALDEPVAYTGPQTLEGSHP